MKKLFNKTVLFLTTAALLLSAYAIPAAAKVRFRIRSNGSGASLPWWFYLIAVILIVLAALGSVTAAKKTKEKKRTNNQPKDYTAQIVNEMIMLDPGFASDDLTKLAQKDLTLITQSISNRDVSALQSIESEELFNRHLSEVEGLASQGYVRNIVGVNIMKSFLHLYRRDKNYEYLTVCVTAQMKDYIFREDNNSVVQGSMDMILLKHYLLTFMRSKNVRTAPAQPDQQFKCPNCGAPMDITKKRVCDYCHSIIHVEKFGWVLYDVEVLGELDKADNRGILIEDNSDVKFTKQSGPFYTGYFDNGIEDKYRDPFEDDDYNKNFNK